MLVKQPNDKDVPDRLAVEDHVGLVGESAVAGANLLSRCPHLRIVAQQIEAAAERVEVPFRLRYSEFDDRLVEDVLDVPDAASDSSTIDALACLYVGP